MPDGFWRVWRDVAYAAFMALGLVVAWAIFAFVYLIAVLAFPGFFY